MEAQTVSNSYLAIENDLTIIPIINKVDLDSARPEEVTHQIMELIGCEKSEIISASAKSGVGGERISNTATSIASHATKTICCWK